MMAQRGMHTLCGLVKKIAIHVYKPIIGSHTGRLDEPTKSTNIQYPLYKNYRIHLGVKKWRVVDQNGLGDICGLLTLSLA